MTAPKMIAAVIRSTDTVVSIASGFFVTFDGTDLSNALSRDKLYVVRSNAGIAVRAAAVSTKLGIG
jgi:hypothetical protein